jgi:hypothetical protein
MRVMVEKKVPRTPRATSADTAGELFLRAWLTGATRWRKGRTTAGRAEDRRPER